MRRAAWFLLICVMAAGMGAVAFAAEPEKPKVQVANVTGEVSAASSSGIAVQFSTSEQGAREIYLPVDKKTKFQRFGGPSQLKPGDTVQVVYEQKYQEPEKGKKVYLGAVATEVVLLKQAPAEGALVSKDEGGQ